MNLSGKRPKPSLVLVAETTPASVIDIWENSPDEFLTLPLDGRLVLSVLIRQLAGEEYIRNNALAARLFAIARQLDQSIGLANPLL